MSREFINNAYIDGANLHNALRAMGWNLDYKRFRIWLSEKYLINQAYIFLGFIKRQSDLYKHLKDCGFILIFKEVVYDKYGNAKGNCDADLVLQMVQDFYENKFEKAVIVSSDGDYANPIRFLERNKRFMILLSPSAPDKCSILLKRMNIPIAYLNDQRSNLEIQNEKAPDADETA